MKIRAETACRQVHLATLSLKESLATFQSLLEAKGDCSAVRAVEEMSEIVIRAEDRIASRVLNRRIAKTSARNIKSPLRRRTKADKNWKPTTWTGIHAELLTDVIQLVEISKRALSSPEIMFDFVTQNELTRVLELFEQLLWLTESNAPKQTVSASTLERFRGAVYRVKTEAITKSCALVNCSPTAGLKVIPGIINRVKQTDESVWFIPRADKEQRRVKLSGDIFSRLISLHPERQILFLGCTHIIEVSLEELRLLGGKLVNFVEHPLSDFRVTPRIARCDSSISHRIE